MRAFLNTRLDIKQQDVNPRLNTVAEKTIPNTSYRNQLSNNPEEGRKGENHRHKYLHSLDGRLSPRLIRKQQSEKRSKYDQASSNVYRDGSREVRTHRDDRRLQFHQHSPRDISGLDHSP